MRRRVEQATHALRARAAGLLTRGPVIESGVMGRTAVAVCVAAWQLPGIGYLLGVAGSVSIDDASRSSTLPVLWSACFFLAGCLMGAVYLLRQESDRAVAEVGVLVLFVVAMSVYLVAILARADSLDGQLAIIALLGSMIVNCTGRAFLLVRQLAAVRRTKRTGL